MNGKISLLGFFIAASCTVAAQVSKESIDRGKEVYSINCVSCHMENGEGVEGTFPPLVKSEFVSGDTRRLINIVLQGQAGEIVVNGKTYNMDMPAQSHLSDEEVADVLNYIKSSWGNKTKKAVAAADVQALRK
jgi:mono/diheme cytochrome c family protein